MRALTLDEQTIFAGIAKGDPRFFLSATEFNGIETAMICLAEPSENESGVDVSPVAIFVTPEMQGMIKPPSEGIELYATTEEER